MFNALLQWFQQLKHNGIMVITTRAIVSVVLHWLVILSISVGFLMVSVLSVLLSPIVMFTIPDGIVVLLVSTTAGGVGRC